MPTNFSTKTAPFYELTAGNIGTVYRGPCQAIAEAEFDEYVQLSKVGYGRVSGESITLFKDGEIIKEHAPELVD
ncbi:MAG: hypothetical protein KJ945_02220 [Gammaproteobacteria bacterium]|nr:hypothetical protein [Gammaproteobacteria bacterium]MBU0801653.1 hypothetical protein [Alphaproteobacteria bacterium]MBU0836149.1 hypothetical protein [Gammaproteobacteria bacterium]MBU1803826.1 hypothetical protein [Gammaproteobacteria bacterium]